MNFGDYCYIEQKRHGAPNEMYHHKVIGRLQSTAWVDVPVQSPASETNHGEMVDVIACVCCGVSERNVLRYRTIDCRPAQETPVDDICPTTGQPHRMPKGQVCLYCHIGNL
jgi:hypothetical protein